MRQTVTSAALQGFFVGWPSPPSPERHLELLRASTHVVFAVEGERVVGFVTAISDGTLSAYIPLLEVLPEYQRCGVGSELGMRALVLAGVVGSPPAHL
jgi:ribosomal protein S18 acetylase RimI-like enzyme